MSSWIVLASIADAITFILCPASVALLAYWAFKPSAKTTAKPAQVYDYGPADTRLYPVDRASPEHVMRCRQFRQMLRSARNDDEVDEAIGWALWVLRLSESEINERLDEVSPLGSDDQRAALAVRRMYITGFSA